MEEKIWRNNRGWLVDGQAHLPELSELKEKESTYITFSKSLTDFDRAVQKDREFYFSKMVALKLPEWKNSSNPDDKFYADLSSVGIMSDNPNIALPKTIQYYMENILRHEIGEGNIEVPELTELAFWKTLEFLGLTEQRIKDTIKISNGVFLSNYIEASNNQGWGHIITQVPNRCELLKPEWKVAKNVSSTVQSDYTDLCIFDNGNKQFIFEPHNKEVLDFENFEFDNIEEQEIEFNTLLLFYKDMDGVEKLHGINFINPYKYDVGFWSLQSLEQVTNIVSNVGYQFIFNFKSVNNNATKTAYYEQQEHSFYNNFGETLGALNSFLKEQTKINK